jgi:hypothetical protein
MKDKTKPIQIRDIPVGLWNKVRAKAILEGKSVKEVVIRLFEDYVRKEG